jgi:hypothetical protein
MAFKRSGVRFPSPPLGRRKLHEFVHVGVCAGIAQLVEHNLAKVGVAGSSPVSRSESIVVSDQQRLFVITWDEMAARRRSSRAAAELGG